MATHHCKFQTFDFQERIIHMHINYCVCVCVRACVCVCVTVCLMMRMHIMCVGLHVCAWVYDIVRIYTLLICPLIMHLRTCYLTACTCSNLLLIFLNQDANLMTVNLFISL